MANPWDDAYSQYDKRLREGEMDADFLREVYGPLGGKSEKGNSFADRVIAIHQELEAQGKKFKVPVSGGNIGKEDTIWDTAFRLAETGTDSIYDLGQRTVESVGEGENGPVVNTTTELYHKPTGAAVYMPYYGFKNDYKLHFAPDGTPVAYSTPKQSDWMKFREDFLRPAVNFAAPFIPGVGPYIAAANAAYSASKGDWEKALLSGLSAAIPMAGQFGASADTVSMLKNAKQAANVLKALESEDLLGAFISGSGLAGVTEVAGFDIKDINKALGLVRALGSEDPAAIIRAGMGYLPKGETYKPNPADFEADRFTYDQDFDPNTAGLVDLSEEPGDPDYKFTTDFSVGADYSLAPKEDGLGFKVTAPSEVFNSDGSINYDLFDYDKLAKLGMDMPKSGNLEYMRGGQGLRIPVKGGYITEDGFVPEGYTPNLGDPNSFINKPAPNATIKPAPNATIKPPSTPGKLGVPPKTNAPDSGVDLNALMALLGGGQQQAPMVVTSGQDNSADIELMQDIFGPTMSAPSAGDPDTQTRELARLMRS